jgi:uroporphyrinogen III methyltransferase / synthase
MPHAQGKVYLIGAGPGEPGLLTLRGRECLAESEVVLYDYLVNPRILRNLRPETQAICLGAHGQTKIWTQAEINARLVTEALAGKKVSRLKGGDPAIFGRLAEELEALRAHQIDYEIVPGVTAALAAACYAEIPITHRDLASAVAFIAGHEDDDKSSSSLDYEALARFPGTLVVYMGVTRVQTWTNGLLAAGKSSETPVAIIRRASLPDQVVVHSTLGATAAELTPASKLRPPVIVIVGSVAALGPALSWFERRPLYGQKVVITRAAEQADELRCLIEQQGGEVFEQPAIEIDAPADWAPVDEMIGQLARFDWLVFSSSNGVEYFLQRLFHLGLDARAFGEARIAAIGPGTAERLAKYHLRAELVPEAYRAEALASALAPLAPDRRFLLLRASRGREVLADELRAAGGEVEQVVVYDSCDVTEPVPRIAALLKSGNIDWMTVTSSAIARSLARMFGDDLRNTKLASISPITSATLRAHGFSPATEATEYTLRGVVDAITRMTSNPPP